MTVFYNWSFSLGPTWTHLSLLSALVAQLPKMVLVPGWPAMELDPYQKFVANIRKLIVLFPRLRETNYGRVVSSFEDLDWGPDLEGIDHLRRAFEKPWRAALIETWLLGWEQISKLVTVLKDSDSDLVGGMIVSVTEDCLQATDPGTALRINPGRKRHRLEGAKIGDIRSDDQHFINFLRLLNMADLSGLGDAVVDGNGADPGLKEMVLKSMLPNLLRASLQVARDHAEKFLLLDDSAERFGCHSHIEDFGEAKAKVRGLLSCLPAILGEDPVDLICGRAERLRNVIEVLSEVFVTTVIAFSHVEARWMLYCHPTSMGRVHGREVLSLREELLQGRTGWDLRQQVRAAGLLVAELSPYKDGKILQDLKGLAGFVASQVPAIGSFFNAELLHRLIRRQEYGVYDDGNLDASAPRPEASSYYAHPPPQARVNGHQAAPLAGDLELGQSLGELATFIDGVWSGRPARDAVTLINAATLAVWTWRVLPGIRKAEHRLQDWNIPLVHQRFLTQGTLPGAVRYQSEAAGDDKFLKDTRWRVEVEAEVDRLRMARDDINLGVFTDWLRGWRCPHASIHAKCGCGVELTIGKNPVKALLHHLKAFHSQQGRRARAENEERSRHLKTYQSSLGQPTTKKRAPHCSSCTCGQVGNSGQFKKSRESDQKKIQPGGSQMGDRRSRKRDRSDGGYKSVPKSQKSSLWTGGDDRREPRSGSAPEAGGRSQQTGQATGGLRELSGGRGVPEDSWSLDKYTIPKH